MSKIKYEADDEMPSDSNTIVLQNEGGHVDIKQEPELMIESEFPWVPTNLKDEQQEYHQYQDNDGSNFNAVLNSIKPDPMDYKEFSIEYIENEWEIDEYNCSNDMDEDNCSNYMDDDIEDNNICNYKNYSVDIDCNSNAESTQNQNLFQENEMDDNEQKDSTKAFTQRGFFIWMRSKYIKYLCPICDEICKTEAIRATHITKVHKNLIDKTKSLHYNFIGTSSKAICKLCKRYVNKDCSLLLHYLRHSKPETFSLYACNLCQIKSQTCSYIQNHINEQHAEAKESFISIKKKSDNDIYECPSCPDIYRGYSNMRFHFIDKHPIEYWEMYTYSCHLCPNSLNRFDNVLEFYKHLLKEHNLNDLKLLDIQKFTKYSDEHFICTKCFKIFTEMDMKKFLRHYLEHANYFWSCRTCYKEISLRVKFVYHMCGGLFNKYRTRAEEIRKKERKTLSNWQEFEDYMKHVCSFCNKEFETLQNWQIHLRKSHQLDTLKGLEMKEIPNESTKLQCTKCNTFVLNSSVELHIHRFQHLPYKPYKCRRCTQTFINYKIALNHVLRKCQDQHSESQIKIIKKSHEIVCPLCSNLKFVNKKAVLQHYSSKHNNFQNYYTKHLENTIICNVCELQLADDENVGRMHVLRHFDQKTHKCLECFQSFHNRAPCLAHVNRHFTKPITKQKQLDTPNSLVHSNDQNLNSNKTRYTKTVYERSSVLHEFIDYINYACPKCNVCLASHQLWQDHIHEKHDIFQEDNICTKDPSDGSFKCIHCQLKISNSIAQRQKHKLTHMPYKSFICNICYHRCCSLGVLYGHLRRLHLTQGSYKCPICPDILPTPLKRQQHLNNSHSPLELPDNLCIECCKMYSSKYSLKVHMVTHDINRTKFECKYCGAKLIHIKDLTEHESKHESNIVGGTTANEIDAICTETPNVNDKINLNAAEHLCKENVKKI